MSLWLLASGDFVPLGGMDTANHGLASYLARQATAEVHLVAHQVSPDLTSLPALHVHRVPRPFGSHALGEPLLTRAARRASRVLTRRGARVVANGGNMDARDVSWVHYVHAAYRPSAGGLVNGAIVRAQYLRHVAAERRALCGARVVICNSARTVTDVVERVGVDPARVRQVDYGIDPARFQPGADSREAKGARGLSPDRPLALFIGALGDRRKGFDTLFASWAALCARADWDVDLIVAGSGSELPAWRARVAAHPDLAGRVHLLGYRTDIPALLAAADVLVHPARYEAYGLAVHEALCCGVPAIVTASAGVAARYPGELRGLLLGDPESASELVSRLRSWRDGRDEWRARTIALSSRLRARTWDHMAQDFVANVTSA